MTDTTAAEEPATEATNDFSQFTEIISRVHDALKAGQCVPVSDYLLALWVGSELKRILGRPE